MRISDWSSDMCSSDLHIVEEYFLHMAYAARKLVRTHGDAWCLIVDPKIGWALVLRDGRVGAHDDDAIIAILRPARPHFLAVDLPAVAVGLGASAQPRKIRPARGFGKELAPDFLALQGLQHTLFYKLAVAAELHQNGHRHAE